jgi:hypothetical protein
VSHSRPELARSVFVLSGGSRRDSGLNLGTAGLHNPRADECRLTLPYRHGAGRIDSTRSIWYHPVYFTGSALADIANAGRERHYTAANSLLCGNDLPRNRRANRPASNRRRQAFCIKCGSIPLPKRAISLLVIAKVPRMLHNNANNVVFGVALLY